MVMNLCIYLQYLHPCLVSHFSDVFFCVEKYLIRSIFITPELSFSGTSDFLLYVLYISDIELNFFLFSYLFSVKTTMYNE